MSLPPGHIRTSEPDMELGQISNGLYPALDDVAANDGLELGEAPIVIGEAEPGENLEIGEIGFPTEDAGAPAYVPSPRFSAESGRGDWRGDSVVDSRSQRPSAVSIMNQLPSQQPASFAIASHRLRGGTAVVAHDFSPADYATMGGRAMSQKFQKSLRDTIHGRRSRKMTRKSTYFGLDAIAQFEIIEEAKRSKAAVRTQAAPMSLKLEMIREERTVIRKAKEELSTKHGLQKAAHVAVGGIEKNVVRSFNTVTEGLTDLRFWNKSIKQIQGKHGAAVGTYFTFLRWCLVLNLLGALLWIGLVIIPQERNVGFNRDDLVVPAPEADSSYTRGLGIFTGGGALNQSAYFIGSYLIPYDSNVPNQPFAYNLPLAYLLTGFGFLTLTFLSVFLTLGQSYKQGTLLATKEVSPFSLLVMTSWDHTIENGKSVSIAQKNAAQLLKGALNDVKAGLEGSYSFTRKLLVNVLIVVILTLCLWGLQATIDRFADDAGDVRSLIPSIVLAFLNTTLPLVFEIISRTMEFKAHEAVKVLQLTVLRSLFLRVVGLYVFFFTLYSRRELYMCWESYIAQQIYLLFVVFCIVELGTTLLRDVCTRTVQRHWAWTAKLTGPPRFLTVKNFIELVFSQALIWFGSFYCPMLPLLGVAKCFCWFWIKKWTTLRFCESPKRAFRASQSLSHLVLWTMLLSLFAVTFPFGYTVVELVPSGAEQSQDQLNRWFDTSNFTAAACTASGVTCKQCLVDDRVDGTNICHQDNFGTTFTTTLGEFCAQCPSGCGPFRNQISMYETLSDEFNSWPDTAREIVGYIGSLAFAATVAAILCMWIYLATVKIRALRSQVERLTVERELERMDKLWILQKYQIDLGKDKAGI